MLHQSLSNHIRLYFGEHINYILYNLILKCNPILSKLVISIKVFNIPNAILSSTKEINKLLFTGKIYLYTPYNIEYRYKINIPQPKTLDIQLKYIIIKSTTHIQTIHKS
jgi:hypothetical protein